MNKFTIKLVAAGILAAVSTGATAGIAASQHDMTATGTGQLKTATEICVFCHTPHASATGSGVPLWNKDLATHKAGVTYTPYASSTMDGAATDASIKGGISMACLSCHDGTQGMDAMFNNPGSGQGTQGGTATNNMSPGAGSLLGASVTNAIAMLGSDLSNDHPIGIPYAGGGAAAAVTAKATYNDPDFNFSDVNNSTGVLTESGGYMWLERGAGSLDAAARDKQDIILYNRTGIPYVECGSCHDPHNAATKAAGSVAFLRVANTGSTVCLSCHNK